MFLGGEGSSSAVVLVMWPHTPPPPHWTACRGPSGSLVPHTEHSQVEPSGLCSAAMPNRRVWWKVACHVVRRHMGFYLETGGSSWLSWVCVARPPSVAHRSAPDEHLGSCHHSLWCLLLRMAGHRGLCPNQDLKSIVRGAEYPLLNNLDRLKWRKYNTKNRFDLIVVYRILHEQMEDTQSLIMPCVPRSPKEASNADCVFWSRFNKVKNQWNKIATYHYPHLKTYNLWKCFIMYI